MAWFPETDKSKRAWSAARTLHSNGNQHVELTDERARAILEEARTIAVVGASPNPARPSNQVASYMAGQGYEIIPVRPKVAEILGTRCYPSLEEIPVQVDIVVVFRRAEACPDVARAAVAIGAGVLWLQEGIVSAEAMRIAQDGGLEVIMDQCIKKVRNRLWP